MIFYACTWHKAKAIDRSCRPQANLHPSSLARLALIVFMCTEDQNASDWSSERSSSRFHMFHMFHMARNGPFIPFYYETKTESHIENIHVMDFPWIWGPIVQSARLSAQRLDRTRPWPDRDSSARSFGGPHCVSKRVNKHQLINDVEW